MGRIDVLSVLYHERLVGRMALYKKSVAAFEYDRGWVQDGFALNPFSLPLQQEVFFPAYDPFGGLFGVFADSLPDGWGRLLVDRLLGKQQINPLEIGEIERLAIVGSSGMGALTYQPETKLSQVETGLDLDQIAVACGEILNAEPTTALDELFELGGSSGGARPKILTKINGEDWLIKFPSSHDLADIGKREYQYSLCAKSCGLPMEETRLFPSRIGAGYFGTRRFDRRMGDEGEIVRIHMVSVGGMLETSHRLPALDYNILMRLTLELTKDFAEVEKMYRMMCFNVFAHNRDDHAKNFSFLYDEEAGGWRLAPAYDLTYSFSLGGEHATSVNGNGRNPGLLDLLQVGENIGIKTGKAKKIAEEIRDVVVDFQLF